MTDSAAPLTDNTNESSAPRTPSLARRCGIAVLKLLIWAAAVVAALWSAAAVYFTDVRPGAAPRTIVALLVAAAFLAAFVFARKRWRFGIVAVLFVATLAWFLTRTPRHDRNWAPEVAVEPAAIVSGDTLTINGVRNFRYRSETDFDVAWETRTYDLSKLRTLDYCLTYWGSPAIAHVTVSFGFEDGQYLAVSIETRKEIGEQYSAVQGFFRQYELVYVFADERDVIGLRTNHRNEDVYMYRFRSPPHRARSVLMSYVDRANELRSKPEFYNALTSNCSTNVMRHFSTDGLYISPWQISLMLNGYSGRLAHDMGATVTTMSFEELHRRSHINAAANAAGDSPEFSRLIRVGVPNPLATSQPTR